MAEDKQLVLAYFENEAAADRAAEALKAWDKASDEIKLGNVGVLVKDAQGEVKQQKLGPRDTAKGAGIGLVLGVLAAPFTAGLSMLGGAVGGAVGGGAIGTLFRRGLPEEEVERIGGELDAGHAAVGALVEEGEAAQVTAKLTELGGTAEAHAVSGAGLEQAQAAAQVASAEPPATATTESAATTAPQPPTPPPTATQGTADTPRSP
jgi:uncharacterized membrane protein